MMRTIDRSDSDDQSDSDLQKVLEYFRAKKLRIAETTLLAEWKQQRPCSESLDSERVVIDQSFDYTNEYEQFYEAIRTTCSERCKPELMCFLFPIFAAVCLQYVLANNQSAALEFCQKFGHHHEPYLQEYVRQLRRLIDAEEMNQSPTVMFLRSKETLIRISRESERELRRILLDLPQVTMLIKQSILVESTDEPARSLEAVEAIRGSLVGEASKVMNRSKIYTGIFRDFSALSATTIIQDNESCQLDESTSNKASKKKKLKTKDSFGAKKMKADPNAPPWNRVPLPIISDSSKAARIAAMNEASKRCKFLAENRPSIYFYTIRSSHAAVCSLDVSDDSTLLICGFNDSSVRVESLSMDSLKCLKPSSELESLNLESDYVENEIWDETSSQPFVRFTGHSGPVYGVSYNDDKNLIASCSEDGTVRLWSVPLRACLVTYRYDITPILDVQFGPFGGYFATGDFYGGAYVWAVEKHSPVRMLDKHFLAVNRVMFHPNSNYLATASSDRTVRLWDLVNGNCVRLFTGHKNSIHSLCFSPDGRALASGCTDGVVNLWDVGQGRLIHSYVNHGGMVNSLSFSRDCSTIVSGGMDERIFVQSVAATSAQTEFDADPSGKKASSQCSFRTKKTPVQLVHFTRRNLILGFGGIDKTAAQDK